MLEFPVYAVTIPTYSDQGQGLPFRAIGRYTVKLSLLRLSTNYQAFSGCNNCVRTRYSVLFCVIHVFCLEVDKDIAKVTCNGQNVICRVTINIYIMYCISHTYVTYMNIFCCDAATQRGS
jgi:hypothetical protein